MNENPQVIVVGGGASGLTAAIVAAQNGAIVTVLEQNENPGRKICVTGNGRCNLTNACDMDALFASVRTNSRFLYSAFYQLDSFGLQEFFVENTRKLYKTF